MAEFAVSIELVMHSEGGYWKGFSDTFKDPGGETYQGIARNFHPNWDGWTFIDEQKKIGPISWNTKFPQLEKQVRHFYRQTFWEPLKLSEIKDQAVANSLMDLAVNLGSGRAVSKLQMMLNQRWNQVLKVDGNLGPKTIEVLNKLPPHELNTSIFKMRVEHHMKKADRDILPALIERCMTYLVG
jgi:lysozyme family protein